MSARRGFSLIEALVAMAIVAMALLALYELQQQLVRGERRTETALAAAELQRNALAVTRDINPTLEPTGFVPLAAGRSVRWTATPLTAPKPNAGSPTTAGRYEIRLYSVRVEVLDPAQRPLTAFSIDRVGWRRLAATPTALPQRPAL